MNTALWVQRWQQHVFPAVGVDQCPAADIMLVANRAPGQRVFMRLVAQNGAHVSFSHFITIVGAAAAQEIWSAATLNQQNPHGDEYMLFEAHTPIYHAAFILIKAQFRQQPPTTEYVHRYVSTWMRIHIARLLQNIQNTLNEIAAINGDMVDNPPDFVDEPRQFFVTPEDWAKALTNEEHTEDRFGVQCTICLQPFLNKQRLIIGVCGHRLHKDCYADMVGKCDMVCPACRGSIVRTMSEDFTVPEEQPIPAADVSA